MGMLLEREVESLLELKKLATDSLILVERYKTVFLVGDLGAGKTTLVKEYANLLGVTEPVTSPTFGYVNEYYGQNYEISHFDLYRLENAEQLYDIGFIDFIDSNKIMFIEWPGLAENYFEEYLEITIERKENCRKFRFQERKSIDL